jgi:hypothetical protein
MFGDEAVARLAFRQQALDFLQRRYVGDDRKRRAALAGRIVLKHGRDQDVDNATVLANHLILNVVGAPGAKELGQHLVDRIFARRGLASHASLTDMSRPFSSIECSIAGVTAMR